MARLMTLPNGQRVLVLGPAEALQQLGCELGQLGDWINAGSIHSCKCPACGMDFVTQDDVNDLLEFAEQFPAQVPLDEIVVERVRSMDRRGSRDVAERKTRRVVDADPRGSGKMRTTNAAYYDEEDDQDQRGMAKRLPAGSGRFVDQRQQRGTLQRSPVGSGCFDDGQQQGARQRSSANAGLRADRDEQPGGLRRLLPGQVRRR